MRIFDVKINQTHQEINKRRNCKKKRKEKYNYSRQFRRILSRFSAQRATLSSWSER